MLELELLFEGQLPAAVLDESHVSRDEMPEKKDPLRENERVKALCLDLRVLLGSANGFLLIIVFSPCSCSETCMQNIKLLLLQHV